ncbi:MAG TPA: hypothetical protein VHY08_21155 [Bacillota bacterium]|nr:hypothetical protein [Bacillota bacterium]
MEVIVDIAKPGSGAADDPYLVCTAEQLNLIRGGTGYGSLSAHYRLGADIDLSLTYSDKNPWQPIGNSATPFTGHFDGNHHVISNVHIFQATSYAGLFGAIQNAEVKNLKLIIRRCVGDKYVGALAGASISSAISFCGVEDDGARMPVERLVSSDQGYCGGLVGENKGRINNCYATINVGGLFECYGGLVGVNDGTISCSYAAGTVSGIHDYFGGLVGVNKGIIINCYTVGQVLSVKGLHHGGIVGRNNFGSIRNCYHAIGEVFPDEDEYSFGIGWGGQPDLSFLITCSYFNIVK